MTALKAKREQLEKLISDMNTYGDDLDAKGELTGENVTVLTKMGQDVKTLADEIRSIADAEGSRDDANAYLASLTGKAASTESTGTKPEHTFGASGIVDPKGMTLGEAFTKSPAYAEFVGQFAGADGRIRNIQGIKSQSFDVPGLDTKTLVTGLSSTSGGAYVTNQRLGVTSDLIGARELTVRDLCTNITISSDTFEYVTVTGKTNNAAAVIEATTAADSTVYGTPEAGNIQGYKPESAMTFAVVAEPVETIAHLIPITRRAAADAPQVRQMIDAFLIQGLREEEEDQILNGDGTSPNLSGITDRAISTVGSAGTDIDAVVAAIAAIRAERRRPNGLVIHPNDWYSAGFLLAKDGVNGSYLMANPAAGVDQLNTLWGLRVVVTEAATENTALVGDFTQAVVADRQQATIYVTDSHKDWFSRNLLAVLAEERLGFGVLDVKAFCTVTSV